MPQSFSRHLRRSRSRSRRRYTSTCSNVNAADKIYILTAIHYHTWILGSKTEGQHHVNIIKYILQNLLVVSKFCRKCPPPKPIVNKEKFADTRQFQIKQINNNSVIINRKNKQCLSIKLSCLKMLQHHKIGLMQSGNSVHWDVPNRQLVQEDK